MDKHIHAYSLRLFLRHTFHQQMVGLGRLELPTSPLSGVRSNQLSYKPASFKQVVELSRIELLTSCVQGRRSPS